MKKKSLSKRLNLNKSTITHLNPIDLKLLKGGRITDITGYTCDYCNTDISCDPEGDGCMYNKSCMIATCYFCF